MAKQSMIVGKPALIVVDIQRDGAMPVEAAGIPRMDGFEQLVAGAERLVAAARQAAIPVIFFQETHRRSGVDFGRELDGTEGPHCVEGEEGTGLWPTLLPQETDYFIAKRRYSCFFGTDLEILLKGLGVSTVVLIGGLTDVCIHYTFADAHQSDYYARVVEDCVLGSSESSHAASLNAMEYLQAGARRTSKEITSGFEELGSKRSSSDSKDLMEVA
jgi:nicotinamidase-related amidase